MVRPTARRCCRSLRTLFGQGKRRFSLARIMAKLAGTSEVVIMVAFMVMNLEKILAGLLFFFTVCMADYPGQPAKVPHIRMQLALDAEDQHQNITDNNNEVLNVAYSASPN